MPFEGTVLLSWTSLYGFTAALYLIVFSRRRVEPEFARFGYVCVAFAIVAYSRTGLVAADSPQEILMAGKLGAVGHYMLGATFVSFCACLAGRNSRLVPFAALWALVGIAMVVTGTHTELSGGGTTFRTRLPATLWFIVGMLLSASALSDAARRRKNDLHVQRIVAASTLCLVGGLIDSVMASLGVRGYDVILHAGIIGIIAVHWMLLDRFGEATEKLSGRRAAYKASLEDLTRKHEELIETEQLAAVGELSSVIAHEVRNPLAVIKNATSALRRGKHGEEANKKLVEILDEETERLHKLTVELDAFAEHSRPIHARCDLRSIFGNCVSRAQAQRAADGASPVTFECHVETGPIMADPELLESSLIYLVQNALDASDEGGTIRLHARSCRLEGESAVEISVSDEGEGMDPETLEKATTPFFTTRSRGTGLALNIVHRVAMNHGGHLMIESKRGAGTIAKLVLPRHRTSLLPPSATLTADELDTPVSSRGMPT